ncbi:hypothetical protein V7G09_04875 [Cutibacterium avidum]|jgi:hypothetical protein|uniref:hypothetical protein n=1 Tax=Cutibacterium avidum TaxID=33010 RepID=UPI00206A5330|nr:hypothetical protein [Cutibacterium avidum]MCO6684761.1 hypothetical protein [Cutibacterium avidum]MDU5841442.1 hypothetical protein [Cutibacterium avidum]MDU7429451.1 hypothetical protein [Cutibacterium avidum]DAL65418.1 MAG TPA_asm: TRYPTOPHAN RNA-BINDING ATTENUATOR PROTEIN-INHIBITORY PROTEIN REGULATION, ANTI-TRAP [Caudoviricetes sp.]
MSTIDGRSIARAEREWLADVSRVPRRDEYPCPECDGSGEGKWGGWCRTCGGDGIDPEVRR